MADDLTLDLWTFDVGTPANSPETYADAVAQKVEESWDSGADLVLLPEFLWMGLEPLAQGARIPSALHPVGQSFWHDLLPSLKRRLSRPGKAVVLGTAPFVDPESGRVCNRAPILSEGALSHQDKLHLTPWEKDFSGGDKLTLWKFRGFRIAVIICLDIEIPEIAARLRGHEVDLILCPSATETVLGVERVDRCASARAVELGCYVGVCHLVGKTHSELIDENVGRAAIYRPSQAAMMKEPRWTETGISEGGNAALRVVLSKRQLEVSRRFHTETNPSLLGRETAGMERVIQIESDEPQPD